MNSKMLCPDEVYAIQGAIFDVNRVLGAGFLEDVYQECLEDELTLRGIPWERQKPISLFYKGDEDAQMDMVIFSTGKCGVRKYQNSVTRDIDGAIYLNFAQVE